MTEGKRVYRRMRRTGSRPVATWKTSAGNAGPRVMWAAVIADEQPKRAMNETWFVFSVQSVCFAREKE